jgi:drug/metabolite transporter (DMT)-like permease
VSAVPASGSGERGFGPRSLALLVVLACTWGASYLFIKVSLRELPVGWVLFLRTLLGAAALTPLVLAAGSWRLLRGHVGAIVVLGLTQNALALGLVALGEVWIPSSLAGVLVATAPLFTALFAVVVDSADVLRGLRLVGLLVGFLGVVVVLGPDLGSGWRLVAGALCVLATAMIYGFAAHWVRRRLVGVPRVAMVWASVGTAALATLPIALADLPSGVPGFRVDASIVVLGVAGTGIAFVIFNHLVAEVGPSRASLVGYIGVVVSVVLGVAGLGERFTVATAAGVLLILGGCYGVART